jgi:hypothetical protein
MIVHDVDLQLEHQRDRPVVDQFDERFGMFGSGGVDPTLAAALRGVPVERELADDQHFFL